MRDFFIGTLDKLIGAFVVIALLVVLFGGLGAMVGGGMMGPGGEQMGGGVLGGLLILVFGALYVAFVAGFMYLGLGIYHNTRRTAEAVEKLANR